MTEAAQTPSAASYVWGPLSALGLCRRFALRRRRSGVEVLAFVRVRLASRARVAVTPFVDLVVTWNAGISYGLFQQRGLARGLGVARVQGWWRSFCSGSGWRGRRRG